MPVTTLHTMTWQEVRELDRTLTVPLLPVGALEAHGPHLPLSTDVIISEAMAREGGERLAKRGYHALLLPPIVYTAARFGAGFSGTISLHPQSVSSVILDIARSLSGQGFLYLVIANSHLDPANLDSIEAVAETVGEEELLEFIFPNIVKKPWATRLPEEFQTGACHAGRYEGSVLMAERPDLVREEIQKSLSANPSSLSRAIRDGKTTFEEAGGPEAYFGFPADASAAEGREIVETLGGILEAGFVEAVGADVLPLPRTVDIASPEKSDRAADYDAGKDSAERKAGGKSRESAEKLRGAVPHAGDRPMEEQQSELDLGRDRAVDADAGDEEERT